MLATTVKLGIALSWRWIRSCRQERLLQHQSTLNCQYLIRQISTTMGVLPLQVEKEQKCRLNPICPAAQLPELLRISRQHRSFCESEPPSDMVRSLQVPRWLPAARVSERAALPGQLRQVRLGMNTRMVLLMAKMQHDLVCTVLP